VYAGPAPLVKNTGGRKRGRVVARSGAVALASELKAPPPKRRKPAPTAHGKRGKTGKRGKRSKRSKRSKDSSEDITAADLASDKNETAIEAVVEEDLAG